VVCPTICTLSDGATYRLRIDNLPNRSGVELFPILEIKPITPQTETLLVDKVIPVFFEKDAVARVMAGKSVTNVVYLPDQQPLGTTLVGLETLTNSRMDTETDPIAEADRRGRILAIVRINRTPQPAEKAK
jgi:hypothetical protein